MSINSVALLAHGSAERLNDPSNISLETKFADQCLIALDIHSACRFGNFFAPNEVFPQNIKPHLDLAHDGINVATGTERLFFGLLYSDEKKCQGVVGRDINPRVKAYNDFNTLLLRITDSRQEYVALSSPVARLSSGALEILTFKNRIQVITKKAESGGLPDRVKSYYLKHINDFGYIYLSEQQTWRTSNKFRNCQYHLNDDQFLKLQAYAKSGNIISTIGSINDLVFLQSRRVAVVDSSNIQYYSVLNLQGGHDFQPRVITTCGVDNDTDYFSYIHEPLSLQEDIEFDTLLKLLQSTGVDTDSRFLSDNFSERNPDPFDCSAGAIRSKKTLFKMKKFVADNILQVPGFTSVNMYQRIETLNSLTLEQIEELCKHEQTKRFLNRLNQTWYLLDPSVYFAFSQMPGWKEEFEAYFSRPGTNLSGLIRHLEKGNLLQKFIQDFGQLKLIALLERCKSSDPDFVRQWGSKRTIADLCS